MTSLRSSAVEDCLDRKCMEIFLFGMASHFAAHCGLVIERNGVEVNDRKLFFHPTWPCTPPERFMERDMSSQREGSPPECGT